MCTEFPSSLSERIAETMRFAKMRKSSGSLLINLVMHLLKEVFGNALVQPLLHSYNDAHSHSQIFHHLNFFSKQVIFSKYTYLKLCMVPTLT